MFTVVTSLVTHFEEFKRFNNSIEAHWKELLHPAMRLEIEAICKYTCDCSSGHLYLVNKIILPPNETSYTFTGLAPGSHCDFTLKAVCNPASIDNGISIAYIVLPASKTFFLNLISIYSVK